jgi:RNA polymerase sigma factor (sigma-70 family)
MKHEVNSREGAFNALYDAHYGAVRAYAWRRDPAFAEDIVAEAFLVAWKRLEDVPTDTALPWLLAAARNAHLNIARSERRRRERELNDAASWPQSDVAPEAGGGADRAEVLRLLKQLPEADREVLLLVAWEGLDRAGIAKVLGCSRANVALRLHRARRRFEALLSDAGQIDSEPWPGRCPTGQSATHHDTHLRLFAGGSQHE